MGKQLWRQYMSRWGLSPVAKRESRVGRVNATPYHMMSVSEEEDAYSWCLKATMIMYDQINTSEEDIANMCCWCLIRLCMLWPEDNAVATSCQGGNCLCLVGRGTWVSHLPPPASLQRFLEIVNVSWLIFIDQHHIALTHQGQCQSWQLITKSTNIQR